MHYLDLSSIICTFAGISDTWSCLSRRLSACSSFYLLRRVPSSLLYYSCKLSYLFTYGLFGVRLYDPRVFTPILFHFPLVLLSHGGYSRASAVGDLPSDHNRGITLFTGARAPPTVLTEIKIVFIYCYFVGVFQGR